MSERAPELALASTALGASVCTTRNRLTGGDADPALRASDDLSLFPELFGGPAGDEPADERAARLAAARDILANLLRESVHDAVAREDALYAVRLGGLALLTATVWGPLTLGRRRLGVAA